MFLRMDDSESCQVHDGEKVGISAVGDLVRSKMVKHYFREMQALQPFDTTAVRPGDVEHGSAEPP